MRGGKGSGGRARRGKRRRISVSEMRKRGREEGEGGW